MIAELKDYVENNEDFALQLNMTFIQAGHGPNSAKPITYDDMYNFLNFILTMSPSTENAMTIPLTFYRFAITEMGSKLVTNPKINNWIQRWLSTWKEYLDSFESTEHISTWLDSMDMTDFIIPEQGYQSFNEFFHREIKPNKRPIHSYDDETVIISPVDGVVDYILYNITVDDDDATRFMVKGIEFNLFEIFGNDLSKAKRYENGTLILMSLALHHYHHYHTYCNDARIEDIDFFGGYFFCFGVNNMKNLINNCSNFPDDIPGCHAYWTHVNTRGIVHMKCNQNENQYETALIVVGLGHVSSVNFIVEPQHINTLNKGEKLGHFAFGGSTISLLFPPNTIDQVLVDVGKEMQMGQPLANLKPQFDY